MKKLFFAIFLSCFFSKSFILGQNISKLDFLKNYEYFSIRSPFRLEKYDFSEKQWKSDILPKNADVDNVSLTNSNIIIVGWCSWDDQWGARYVDYLDSNLTLIKRLEGYSIGVSSGGGISPDGQKVFYDNKYANIPYQVTTNVVKAYYKKFTEDYPSPEYAYGMFLRDSKRIIYQNAKREVFIYNTETEAREKITTLNEGVGFCDVAYQHPWILCATNDSLYIFDYEQKTLKKLKTYEVPGFWSFSLVYYPEPNVPRLLVGPLLWRDDDKGFLFGKYQHPFWLDPGAYLNPLIYHWPRTFYYDLETGEEYDLGVSLKSGQWRKKANLAIPSTNAQ